MMGTYSRWALIRGWALIRINTVYVLPVTCLDDQYCGCTPGRHGKSPREKIQCANNPVTQSRDCRVCLSTCSVFPLRRVLKSQQCLHTAGRDKICIIYKQAVILCAWTYWRKCWGKIPTSNMALKWRHKTAEMATIDAKEDWNWFMNKSRQSTNTINKMASYSILEKTRFEIHLGTYVLPHHPPPPFPHSKEGLDIKFQRYHLWEEIEIKILSESYIDVC